MRHQERPHRMALTLLLMGLVLGFMFATLLLVSVLIYLLLRLGVLGGFTGSLPAAVRMLLIFSLSVLLVGAAMTFFFGKFPLRAVNTLINRMNRLAAGDYRARLHYAKGWEKNKIVREVTESFNRLAEELESTEMLRRDFINNFSHEFKTPIVSIVGFTKLIRKGNLPPQEREEYLRIIETESLRLSRMATNVLQLTKVENQTILTDVTEFNLSEQLRSCILLLSEKWERKEIDPLLDLAEYHIRANEELLRQVWINLLDNAVKFTPDGGVIEVTVEEEGESLAVCIRNSGSEIAPQYREKIFHKFYQIDESHGSEGNGVGLAIVKRVTELHHGRVLVQSEDNSTAFTVILPRRCD